jgi:hypothetical protein
MMNLVACHPILHHLQGEGIIYLDDMTKYLLPIAYSFATDSDRFSEQQAVKNSLKQPDI